MQCFVIDWVSVSLPSAKHRENLVGAVEVVWERL